MLIDVNASYGPWPFTPLSCETLKELDQHLAKHGISKALVSPLRAIFYDDPHSTNLELLRQSRRYSRLVPIPTLNPSLADCIENLEHYRSQYDIKAVKLYPNFHNYPLISKRCSRLLSYLEKARLPLILNFRVEDERHLYHALKLKSVSIVQTKHLAKRYAKLKLLCVGLSLDEIKSFDTSFPNIRFDLSFADWYRLIPTLLEHLRPEQLMFGSHTPLMVTEANIYKLKVSPIDKRIQQQIEGENAQKFFSLETLSG